MSWIAFFMSFYIVGVEKPQVSKIPYAWLCECYESPDDTKASLSMDLANQKTISQATQKSREYCKVTLKNDFAFSSCRRVDLPTSP